MPHPLRASVVAVLVVAPISACIPLRGTVIPGPEGAVIAHLLHETCGRPMVGYRRIILSNGSGEIFSVKGCGRHRRFLCRGEISGCSDSLMGAASNPIDITCCLEMDQPRAGREVMCQASTEPRGDKRVVPRSDVPDLCPSL